MVAIWGRFFQKQSNKAEQAVEEKQPTLDLSDRLESYKQFNLEVKEERGGYGDSPAYRSAPRTRYIQRYF